jgi:hypothetical protein
MNLRHDFAQFCWSRWQLLAMQYIQLQPGNRLLYQSSHVPLIINLFYSKTKIRVVKRRCGTIISASSTKCNESL